MNISVNDPVFLLFHTTYSDIILGLYSNTACVSRIVIDKKESSKKLIPSVHELLEAQGLSLTDLDFIGAHIGPGPFTTLRVSVASVNGLAFATQLPLVGVDGLAAFLDEHESEATVVAILDAYCGELYYAIKKGVTREFGCDTFDALSLKVAHQPTLWIGNGVLLYKEKILSIPHAQIKDPLPLESTLESIAKEAQVAWYKKETTTQLLPIYMKSGSAILGKTIQARE